MDNRGFGEKKTGSFLKSMHFGAKNHGAAETVIYLRKEVRVHANHGGWITANSRDWQSPQEIIPGGMLIVMINLERRENHV